MAYGRQIPHEGAGILEAFPRWFNYGDMSHVRDARDTGSHGVATFFCSNAWAAYRSGDLDRIGGFVSTLRAEDHIAAAMLLRQGGRIAYVAEAVVRHSHAPSLVGEFRHYFEVGYVMKEQDALFATFGRMEGRGFRYLTLLCRQLAADRLQLLPYAVVHTGVKWLGYCAGRSSLHAPLALKRALSGNPAYWK
jgi:rhamnosyltransferase